MSSISGSGKTGAMILAAGLGSRLKPWTDSQPKALAKVKGKTLLQRNIEFLQRYNITEVVVNVHHFAEQIIAAINENNGWGSRITISNESEQLLETGGGLLKAAPLFAGKNLVIMMNADILTDMNLQAMIGYHQEKKPLATLATTNRSTTRYFLFDEGNNLCGWQNIKTGEEKSAVPLTGHEQPKAFSGVQLLEPRIFSLIQQTGKFSIVDTYLSLMQTETIKSFDHSESRFIDVGKPESIAKAEVMFG